MDLVRDNADYSNAQILLIEANHSVQLTVTTALSAAGFNVHWVQDKDEVPELFSNSVADSPHFPFDLVVLDLDLPQLDGWTLCRRFRQHHRTVPLLILSERASEDEIVLAFELGADDYLTKPFSIREFVVRCRRLLPIHSVIHSGSPLLQFRDIFLYPQEARVTIRGVEVFLPPREFNLLRVLMERPYYVWSRQNLVQQAWGTEFQGTLKALDVQVKELRKKLEIDPKRPEYIVTVRGIGYRLGTS